MLNTKTHNVDFPRFFFIAPEQKNIFRSSWTNGFRCWDSLKNWKSSFSELRWSWKNFCTTREIRNSMCFRLVMVSERSENSWRLQSKYIFFSRSWESSLGFAAHLMKSSDLLLNPFDLTKSLRADRFWLPVNQNKN